MAAATYVGSIKDENGLLISGRDVDLYFAGGAKAFDLAESADRPGVYYSEIVTMGVNYDVYVDGVALGDEYSNQPFGFPTLGSPTWTNGTFTGWLVVNDFIDVDNIRIIDDGIAGTTKVQLTPEIGSPAYYLDILAVTGGGVEGIHLDPVTGEASIRLYLGATANCYIDEADDLYIANDIVVGNNLTVSGAMIIAEVQAGNITINTDNMIGVGGINFIPEVGNLNEYMYLTRNGADGVLIRGYGIANGRVAIENTGTYFDGADFVVANDVTIGNDLIMGNDINMGGNHLTGGVGSIAMLSVTFIDCLDEDGMGSDSNVKISTQQSIKAYVDNNLVPYENGGGTGNIGVGAGACGSPGGADFLNTAIGEGALSGLNNSGALNNTAVGYEALDDVTSGDYNTTIGAYAGSKITTGLGNICVGQNAGANNSFDTENYNIVIGDGTTVVDTFDSGIAIGKNAEIGQSHAMFIGGNHADGYIDAIIVGRSLVSTSANNITVKPTGASGADMAGNDFSIEGGAPTGDEDSGWVFFKTYSGGASGAALRATVQRGGWGPDGGLTINELSADPADPAEGEFVLWMSDGVGAGDDGDIMWKIQAGAVVKSGTLIDFSAF